MPRSLSPQFIKAMPAPASGNRIEWDAEEKDLGIRITAAGARAFVLRYVAQGRERRMTLGDFLALTLTAARQIAQKHKNRIAGGADPLAHKKARKDALTLGKAAEMYLAGREAGTIGHRKPKPRSMKELRRALETHWKPLHNLPLAEIAHPRIEARLHEMVAAVAKARPAQASDKRKPGAVAANRVREALSALFTWAVKKQFVAINPVALTDRMVPESELKRDRTLSEAEIKLV